MITDKWNDKNEMERLKVNSINHVIPIGERIVQINEANGWDTLKPYDWPGEAPKNQVVDKYKVPNHLALIHSEVSEALEAYRKGDKENFAEECADVFIRLLDMTHGLEIDLAKAIADKLVKNIGRGYRHGGKVV